MWSVTHPIHSQGLFIRGRHNFVSSLARYVFLLVLQVFWEAGLRENMWAMLRPRLGSWQYWMHSTSCLRSCLCHVTSFFWGRESQKNHGRQFHQEAPIASCRPTINREKASLVARGWRSALHKHWDINGESIANMVILSAIHSDRNSKVKTQV